jgi:hypothetical protein
MATGTPTLQNRSQYHAYWGVYPNVGYLPNASAWVGTADQVVRLEEGDTAYVNSISDSGMYQCVAPGTPGALNAVWTRIGGSAYTRVTIDFGTLPVYAKDFVIPDSRVTTSSTIVVLPTSIPASGRVGNDAAWDQLVMSAIPGTGSFTLDVTLLPGPVVGSRVIQYQVL